MRTFLQTTAGGTFMAGEAMTFVVRKDYAEYIFKAGKGFYGIVNFLFNGKNEVMLFASWGTFFKRITNHADVNKLLQMLEKPCPQVIDLMTCKSDYSLVTLSNNEMGIRKTINTSTSRSLIEIMGDPIVVEEARNLVNYCLKLFREIHDHCPFPGWKQGLKEDL